MNRTDEPRLKLGFRDVGDNESASALEEEHFFEYSTILRSAVACFYDLYKIIV